MALAVAIRFAFWAYTGRVWEDALITVLHSEHAAQGQGLTNYWFQGRPTHGFTSPLSVLIPLLGDLIRVGFGLTTIKIVSALASAATVFCAVSIGRDPQVRLSTPLIFVAGAYAAIEHHQILWGMAGMETEVATLALLYSVLCFLRSSPARLGLSLGICMLARPDFAIWAAVVGVWLLIDGWRSRSYLALATTTGIAALVYLPWVIFTTLYYGSPIPNTILAKAAGYNMFTRPMFTAAVIGERLTGMFAALGPAFDGYGTGFFALDGGVVWKIMACLLPVGAYFAVRARNGKLMGLFAYAAVESLYACFLVPLAFGWYRPPILALLAILSVWAVQQVLLRVPGEGLRLKIGFGFASVYLLSLAVILPVTFRAEKGIQEIVENGVRKAMGIYLGKVMKSDETVGCEPLGYVAYYSRRVVYDYPGLTNPFVSELLRAHPEDRRIDRMLRHFMPDYIILRRIEWVDVTEHLDNPWLKTDYRMVKEFAVDAAGRAKLFHPEKSIDMDFLLLQKVRLQP